MKTVYSMYSVPTSVNVLFTSHKIEECLLVPELYIFLLREKARQLPLCPATTFLAQHLSFALLFILSLYYTK